MDAGRKAQVLYLSQKKIIAWMRLLRVVAILLPERLFSA
jgi:hypothetical protein